MTCWRERRELFPLCWADLEHNHAQEAREQVRETTAVVAWDGSPHEAQARPEQQAGSVERLTAHVLGHAHWTAATLTTWAEEDGDECECRHIEDGGGEAQGEPSRREQRRKSDDPLHHLQQQQHEAPICERAAPLEQAEHPSLKAATRLCVGVRPPPERLIDVNAQESPHEQQHALVRKVRPTKELHCRRKKRTTSASRGGMTAAAAEG